MGGVPPAAVQGGAVQTDREEDAKSLWLDGVFYLEFKSNSHPSQREEDGEGKGKH